MRRITLIANCFLIMTSIGTGNCLAQNRPDNDLRLGMSKAQVRTILERNYEIVKPKGEDDLRVITSKTGPLDVTGSLNFSNGKLTVITYEWGSSHEPEAIKVGNALFSVLANLNDAGQSVASVTTEVIRKPGLTIHLVACINSFASRRSGIVRRAASLSSPFMLVLSIFDKLAARRTITSEVSVTSN